MICTRGDHLDRLKGNVWFLRKHDGDRLPGRYSAAANNDTHHARFAHELATRGSAKHRCHEPRLKGIELPARIAKAGQSNTGTRAEPKLGARGKAKKIDALGRYVFTHLPRQNGKPGRGKLIERLTLNQMDLPQIRLRRIARDARTMLYCRSAMSVAVHTQALHKRDTRHRRLGERVRRALVNCVDNALKPSVHIESHLLTTFGGTAQRRITRVNRPCV